MIVPISDCVAPVAATSGIDFARLSASTSIVSVLIAGVVCLIAYWQWRTAREKLRLDLYNRRFDIYVNTLGYIQALNSWEGSREQKEIEARFDRSLNESQFLFQQQSGLRDLLAEVQRRGFSVHVRKRIIADLKSVPEAQEMLDLRLNEGYDDLLYLKEVPQKLGELIGPYLNFHNID